MSDTALTITQHLPVKLDQYRSQESWRTRSSMTHDEHVTLFIAILSGHKGLAQAISVADMAGRLNVSTRQAQKIKERVVESGVLIGSSCGSPNGWYLPQSPEEIQATLSNYKARIRSLARTIRHTVGAAGFQQFVGELQLEFTETEGVR